MNSFLNKQSYLNKFQKGCTFIKRTNDLILTLKISAFTKNNPCKFPTRTANSNNIYVLKKLNGLRFGMANSVIIYLRLYISEHQTNY